MLAIHFICVAIFLLIIVVLGWQMYTSYKALAPSTGSWQAHLWAAASGSATKLWARAVAIVASSIGFLSTATNWLNAPQITDFIQKYADPQWVTAIMAGIFVFTMFVTDQARNRTL